MGWLETAQTLLLTPDGVDDWGHSGPVPHPPDYCLPPDLTSATWILGGRASQNGQVTSALGPSAWGGQVTERKELKRHQVQLVQGYRPMKKPPEGPEPWALPCVWLNELWKQMGPQVVSEGDAGQCTFSVSVQSRLRGCRLPPKCKPWAQEAAPGVNMTS